MECLEHSGLGMLIFAYQVCEKENLTLLTSKIEDDKCDDVFVDANMMFGLPCENRIEELKEFRDFFVKIKEKSLEVENNVILQISRGFGQTRISSNDKEMEMYVNDLIKDSVVLSAWLENSKKGIENTEVHLDNLYGNFEVSLLYNNDELKKKNQQLKKNKVINKKYYKK